MAKTLGLAPLIGIAAVLGTGEVDGKVAQIASTERQCFSAKEFESWRSPDPWTIDVRVSSRRYFRLTLKDSCPPLQWPGSRLIIASHGERICSAIGWDLQVSDSTGSFTQQCVVQSVTPLTAAQVGTAPALLQ